MKYKMYCLTFLTGIHIGEKRLEEALSSFCADTLFSALYQEAIKREDNMEKWLYDKAKTGDIVFSDAFPYIGETYYLPKPFCKITISNQQGDSEQKKAFKSLNYIPKDKMNAYFEGRLKAKEEKDKIKNELGKAQVKTAAAIYGKEQTLPYHIGVFSFKENAGLYVIIGAKTEEEFDVIYDLMDALSFSGIGGERTAGLGRFEIKKIVDLNESALMGEGKQYMSLSVSLPKEEEIGLATRDARYQIKKRSGFVASSDYAPEMRKKKDLFVFSAGSCFSKKFEGDIYDVSDGGKHAVYRYAKPMFWAL